ncbi:MAG: TCP-1/cpn60 chaperonin family protein, partial [Chlamydiota bacterium]|nr:TCP-1/cpn60 chaperonin family protein [Chlamydiota bacterium]
RKAMLEDIAVLTGGQFISDDLGIKLENVTPDMLGTIKKIVIKKDETTIVEGGGSEAAVKERTALIDRQIEDSTSDYDKEKLQERRAKLSDGIAVISVGAATEVEMKEKKDRVDDALQATKAAIEEGVVAGGGSALIQCIDSLQALADSLNEGEKIGVELLVKAVTRPLRQIAENAGEEASVIIQRLKEEKSSKAANGWNALTNEFGDMFEMGILDPVKVTRLAVQYAASIASLLLTTEAVIADAPEEKGAADASAAGAQMPAGMGGF